MTGSMSRTRPRVLYLIVLFLSVSPAAHIFVLIAKFFTNDSSGDSSLPYWIVGRHESEEETASNENISNNNNNNNSKLDHHGSIVGQLVENGQVALEEILYLFDEDTRRHVSRKMTISFMVPTLSFLLLGMIPCFIWCYNFIKSKIWNFKQQSGSSSKQERKQQKLRHNLQKHMLILQEDDSIQTNNKRSTTKTTRKWNIPIPGMTSDMKQILLREQPMLPRNHYDRKVDGECPVCLTEFRCGDCLVWSSNSMCSHCFHYDCILSWLQQQQEGYHRTTTRSRRKSKKACPCCRQPFIY